MDTLRGDLCYSVSMKDYAKAFYRSIAWQRCRAAYMKHVGGLCESCLRRGLYQPGEIVHHRVPISPSNIHDETVTLNFANLELLCRPCHAETHEDLYDEKRKRRYKVDEFGRVTARDLPQVRKTTHAE